LEATFSAAAIEKVGIRVIAVAGGGFVPLRPKRGSWNRPAKGQALLVLVVFWLILVFMSFGLFAPRNATAIVEQILQIVLDGVE
jgi:hypothetical protein